jgi:hypothetical protein
MNRKSVLLLAAMVPVLLTANGCATAVVAGAAAAGGYIAHEKGYRVRNPVTKSGAETGTKSE